jgi:hypothetical protein
VRAGDQGRPGRRRGHAHPAHRRCPVAAATTSDIAAALDRDQYATGDGPCLQAARTGELVRVSVTEVADRWPTFARDAEAAGFGSFLSAPLAVNDDHTGAINCYSARGHGFAELDEKPLALYTSAATALLRTYARYQRARDTAEQLRIALNSRAVIDQAKGILMALRQISADEAFTLLVEQSQRENVKSGTWPSGSSPTPPTTIPRPEPQERAHPNCGPNRGC